MQGGYAFVVMGVPRFSTSIYGPLTAAPATPAGLSAGS